ncbi:MAG: hypothetical protein IPG90_09860 [Bacteroidetes bacterium]|nr:hypothetical protein [Bacteroidota bacterium]
MRIRNSKIAVATSSGTPNVSPVFVWDTSGHCYGLLMLLVLLLLMWKLMRMKMYMYWVVFIICEPDHLVMMQNLRSLAQQVIYCGHIIMILEDIILQLE